MIVKDIMSKTVVSVQPEMKLSEVAEIIFKQKIHGVPVVNDGKIVGIITETDFFTKDSENIFLPTYLEFIEKNNAKGSFSKQEQEKIDKLLDIRAKDIMNEGCLTIFQDMELQQLVDFFRTSNYKTLPVTDEKEELVGIVTRSDMIGLLMK